MEFVYSEYGNWKPLDGRLSSSWKKIYSSLTFDWRFSNQTLKLEVDRNGNGNYYLLRHTYVVEQLCVTILIFSF